MSEVLVGKNLSSTIQGRQLFRDVNFSVNEGESLIIRGPNGVGKTTLLRGLVGLRPLAGEKKWSVLQTDIGYLPQLELGESLPWVNTLDFVETAVQWPIWRGPFTPRTEREKTMALFDEWNISELKNLTLNQLSKGQLQKIAWVRTFRSKKKIYLLDEPLTFLDNKFRDKCFSYLTELKRNNTSFVSIFHDLDIPKALEDKTLEMM